MSNAKKVGKDGLCPHCGADLSAFGPLVRNDIFTVTLPGELRDGRFELRECDREMLHREAVGQYVACSRCSEDLDVRVELVW